MVKLSELQKHDEQAYNLFMNEVINLDGVAWWNECVLRDRTMAGAMVFRKTSQGVDYWWDVVYKVERINGKSYA